MNYGLYTSFLGMRSRQRTLDTQANNIANASTTGFKAERLIYNAVEAEAKGTNIAGSDRQLLVAGVGTSSSTDFSAGALRETGRSLDVAIDGDAFLQIQTPRGPRYTRAGNLTLDQSGQLVTHNGHLVVGESGAITIPQGGEISIGEDGTISAGGQNVDRLKLVRFDNPANALTKEGESLFIANPNQKPLEATNSRVVQGALEGSNINSISEMVAMMQNTREFDSLQRSVSVLMNDLGRKIAGEIGKI
jgi:flagellar basal-body rod protein FlgF